MPSEPAADVVTRFAAHVTADPAAPFLHYFGRQLSRRETSERADALAAALAERGVAAGDRVGICLQNTPVMVLAVLACWRLGAVVVPLNPMLTGKEMAAQLGDAGATLLLAHPATRDALAGLTGLPPTLVSRVDDLAGERPPFDPDETAGDVLTLLERHAGSRPETAEVGRDAPALLTYTSGTTGPSKGAINTRGNVAYEAQALAEWLRLGDGDGILATAPLFHITGMVIHLALALGTGLPLTLTYRFRADVVAAAVHRHRPTFTVGAITAFIALLDEPSVTREQLASLRTVFSGGAPVSPATVDRFRERFGPYIHNIYGLTETTSACTSVPLGATAPVDEASGALSVGLPLPGTEAWVVDDTGREAPPGEPGELVIRGPGVVPGYWQRPEETAQAFPDGALCTGDIAIRDADGWIYIVDRKKDMIIASGYKVWPRDVEDALYGHPAVREVAVVGAPDAYRGETVHAYVSLRAGEQVSGEDLVDFARDRLAPYKRPHRVFIVDELPKTATGKIMRRMLRDG